MTNTRVKPTWKDPACFGSIHKILVMAVGALGKHSARVRMKRDEDGWVWKIISTWSRACEWPEPFSWSWS